MEHFWQNTEGFLDHFEVYDIALDRYDNAHFVEIGTYLGKSVAYLAVEIINRNKNIKVDTIDHYDGSRDGSIYKKHMYHDNLINLKSISHVVNLISGKSTEVAKTYPDNSLELVFIDGSHDYTSIAEDIHAWLPKVKIGGMISGDDYGWEGVIRAVDELVPDKQTVNHTWYWIKE